MKRCNIKDDIAIIPVNNTGNNDISDHYFLENVVVESIEAIVNEYNNDYISELVNDTYSDATDTSVRCMQFKNKLITEINNGQHKELINGLITKIIGRSYSTIATNKTHILNWLTCSPSKQPCILLKKTIYRICIKKEYPIQYHLQFLLLQH